MGHLLSQVAGTQVRESGGLGSFSSASLRGSPSDQVMIYLDGMLLNDASSGSVNLSNIDLMQAAQVDIYRGSTPAQLGIASLGGAIHIQSPAADQHIERLSIGLGSFDTQQFNVMKTLPGERWQSLLGLSHQKSANDFSYLFDNATRFNAADDRETHRRNAATEQTTALLKFQSVPANPQQRDLLVQWFDKQQEVPDRLNSAFNQAQLDTRIIRAQAAQRWQAVRNSSWNSKLALTASHNREHYVDEASFIGLERQNELSETDAIGLGNYWERISENSTLAVNAELRHETYQSIDRLGRLPDSEARRQSLSVALQHSQYLGGQRWLITPSLRYQYSDDDIDVASSSEAESLRNGRFHSDFLAPGIGMKFTLNPRVSLLANIYRYQRLPNFYELFGDRGLFIGNDELEAETGTNHDLGLEWSPASQVHWLQQPNLRLTAFYNDLDKAITRVYDARGVGRSSNIPGAINQGLEWEISAGLGQRSRLQITGTLQDTGNQDRNPAFHNKQLPGQAELVTHVQLTHETGLWDMSYAFYQRSGAYYDTANLLPAADQSLHDLSIQRRWKKLQFAIELRNLTDEIYEDFNGFPKPGRSVFASLTYSGDK